MRLSLFCCVILIIWYPNFLLLIYGRGFRSCIVSFMLVLPLWASLNLFIIYVVWCFCDFHLRELLIRRFIFNCCHLFCDIVVTCDIMLCSLNSTSPTDVTNLLIHNVIVETTQFITCYRDRYLFHLRVHISSFILVVTWALAF